MNKYWCLLFAMALSAAETPRTIYRLEAVAGSANIGDGGLATTAQITSIQGIALDRWGNLYLSDTDHHRIRKVTPAGTISTVAGTGAPGFSGDGGPATEARLNLPYGLAVDVAGYVYVADLGNNRVRRIAPDGVITTVAGTGARNSSGDGGAATQAGMLTPRNVAVDSAGVLYISEFEGHRVRKVTPDGKISTAAGTGIAGFRGDGGPPNSAQIGYPAGLAVDRTGALYIADTQNNRVRKVVNGILTTVLGGAQATAMVTPLVVAVDNSLTLYVADSSFRVRAYTASGTWADFAGRASQGYSGDGGPATKAELSSPRDLAADLSGNLYIADGVRVRRVDSRGTIVTVAGDAFAHAVADGQPAKSAILQQPSAVALDGSGNLFIADTGTQRIRQVPPDGTITTVAGTGEAGAGAEGIPGAASPLNFPMGLAVDPAGGVVISDSYNHRVRQMGADRRIVTVVGTGKSGTGQELMPPLETLLRAPRGVCLDRAGTLYIADTANHRILRAPRTGLVETAAGNGAPGDAGDGGMARAAQLNQPSACAIDFAGNLFIADTLSHRIRKVTAGGTITTVAGNGEAGFSGDDGAATAARLDSPRGVAVDDGGDLFIADTGNHRIRLVTPDGTIRTIAGGDAGLAGDGGPALEGQLNGPQGLALDGAGDLYVADTGNHRVRRLVPMAVIPPDPVILPPTLTAVHAASQRQGPVAPGEIILIYGAGLGPESGVAGAVDASGLMGNRLADVEVRFDGVAAPILYAQAAQLNVQVPYTVSGVEKTHVEVLYHGKPAGTLDLPVVAAAPALFPVVVNQDGQLNGETAPAARGTVIAVFATGEGMREGSNVSGLAASAPFPRPKLPVTLTIAGISAEILFAGGGPGLIGTLQVNARVPGGMLMPGPVPVELQIGPTTSPPLTIWIK